jgi:hypothetical protein
MQIHGHSDSDAVRGRIQREDQGHFACVQLSSTPVRPIITFILPARNQHLRAHRLSIQVINTKACTLLTITFELVCLIDPYSSKDGARNGSSQDSRNIASSYRQLLNLLRFGSMFLQLPC